MNQTIDVHASCRCATFTCRAPIGWWPPAPGWWLLAALVLAGLALYAVHYYRARHKRAALRAMTRVRTALEQGAEPVACLQSASTILRRFAMTSVAAPRGAAETLDVPGLIGERWLKFLDGCWGRTEFSAGAGQAVAGRARMRGRTASSAPPALELDGALHRLGCRAAGRRTRPRRA